MKVQIEFSMKAAEHQVGFFLTGMAPHGIIPLGVTPRVMPDIRVEIRKF